MWTEYYSAKSVYGSLVTPPLTDPTAELTPAFWHNVSVAFENDDVGFQEYETRKSRGFTPGNCTGSCKSSEICQMRAAEAQYNCATITPGISFKKRDLENGDGVLRRAVGEALDGGECEGSLMRPILVKLAGHEGVLEQAVLFAQEKSRMQTM